SVNVPVKTEALLSISAGDSIKVWLNGAEIIAEENIGHFGYGNIVSNIVLENGTNNMLIKSARRSGNWNIGVNIFDRNGRTIPGIDFSFDIESKENLVEETVTIFPVKKGENHINDTRKDILHGLLLERSGYPKYARDYFLAVFEDKPMNLFAKIFAAEAYKEAKEEGKYIDILNLAILKTNSEVPAFLNRRGEFYSIKNQQERAEDDFKKVLELNPQSLRGHLNLAKLYRSKKWHEDSRRTIQAALELWPDSTLLLLDMATTLERLGYIDDAGIYFNRAARLFPGNSSLQMGVTDFERRKKDTEAALKWVKKALRFNPYSRMIYFRLHDLSRQMKLYNNAFEYLDAIESFSPDNAFMHTKRGDLYYELLLPEKALESWEKAHQLNPGDTYLTERIAFLKVEVKDITLSFLPDDEKIMESVKKALEFEPHEGAESLLVYDHAACKINSDGSSRWVVTEVSRALNDTGRDNLINVFLPYGGRKKIINAYSIDSELKKSEASSVSSYDVRFRQLKKGDFTVVQYIHYKPAPLYLENNFFGQWFMRSPYQHVIYSEWNLIYPEGKELNIDVASERVEESKKNIEDGLVVHTFLAHDIEPLIHEYYSPPINDYIDTISVSTVKNWDQYVSWERALLRDAFASTAETREKYEELTTNKKTVNE
ncbi:MAG TPA: tetratricopeptide repeat protein, partial [bacterium]|nr:tetratricopeptide repeat protein [bacterium]